MKKINLSVILCIFLLHTFPICASANSTITTGYTQEGIYYEAVTLEFFPSFEILADTDTIKIAQEIAFNGIIVPTDSIEWIETIQSVDYIGTLYLDSYYHFEGKTYAIYTGILYRENNFLR